MPPKTTDGNSSYRDLVIIVCFLTGVMLVLCGGGIGFVRTADDDARVRVALFTIGVLCIGWGAASICFHDSLRRWDKALLSKSLMENPLIQFQISRTYYRVGGVVSALTGVCLVLFAIFVPQPTQVFAVISPDNIAPVVVGVGLLGFYVMYFIWKRGQERAGSDSPDS